MERKERKRARDLAIEREGAGRVERERERGGRVETREGYSVEREEEE